MPYRQTDDQLLNDLLEAPVAAPDKKIIEAKPSDRFESILDLVKALAWPIFALIVLVSFWRPFHAAADLLPQIVSRSNTIKIGELTLEVGRNIAVPPTEEVKQVLAKMLPDDINKLLELPGEYVWKNEDADAGRIEAARLIDLGLIREMTAQELQDVRPRYNYVPVYGVVKTRLGGETRQFLTVVISTFTQELAQQQK